MAFKDYSGLVGDVFTGVTGYFGSVENKKAAEAQAEALKQKGMIEKIFKKVDTKEHTSQIVKDLLIK